MSDYDKVKTAAEFLDKYAENKQWRDKVDISRISMGSTSRCILGQVYGEYHTGKEALRNNPGWGSDAFCDYTEEWQRYLRENPTGPLRTYVGKWTGNEVVLLSEFQVNGVGWVAYKGTGGNSRPVTDERVEFDNSFTLKPTAPKYREGGLYVGRDGKNVFMYTNETASGTAGFFRLNGPDVSGYISSTVENNFGPLVELKSGNKTFTAVRD